MIGSTPSTTQRRPLGGAVSGVALVLALAFAAGACSDAVEVPNRAPSAAVSEPILSPSERAVDVYYTVDDLDGDDLAIAIEACVGSDCTDALTPAPGGDGVINLPSLPDRSVTHLFRWDAGCDDVPAGQTTRIRVTPRDGESTGVTVYSPPFTLESLGFDSDCGAEAEWLEEGTGAGT